MSLDFYYFPASAPCRSVLLTAEAIGITLNLKFTNILKGEHLTPEYAEINPLMKIPCLVDGDYKLSESRAIMAYLVTRYGENLRLYPTDPRENALVNQRLYFDAGTLTKAVLNCYRPLMMGEIDEVDPDMLENVNVAFKYLDGFLEGVDFLVGGNLTIADLSIAATVSQAEMFGFDMNDFENVIRWMDNVANSAPGYRRITNEGLEIVKQLAGNESGE